MSPRNAILLLVLVALALGVGAAIQSVQRNAAPTPAAPSKAPKPNRLEGERVTFTITRNGQKTWTLRAQQAQMDDTTHAAQLQGVEGQTYNAQGKPVATFKSPHGQFQPKDNVIHLTGGVEASSLTEDKTSDDDAVRLTAPELTWSTREPEATAQGGVTIRRPGQVVSQAQRCRFTLDFSKLTLQGGARTEVSL